VDEVLIAGDLNDIEGEGKEKESEVNEGSHQMIRPESHVDITWAATNIFIFRGI